MVTFVVVTLHNVISAAASLFTACCDPRTDNQASTPVLFSVTAPSDSLRKAMREFHIYSADDILKHMEALRMLLSLEHLKELRNLLIEWGTLPGWST